MRHEYVLVDVFTDQLFGGNALAVFRDGKSVPEQLMQPIANELKHAETTFVLPATKAGDHRVRIFTPEKELPFAGHPTLGTAFVLTGGRDGTLRLEEGVGTIPVSFHAGFGQMTQLVPSFLPAQVDVRAVAQVLSLEPEQIRSDVPLEVGSSGVPFLFAALRDLDAVRRCRPRQGIVAESVYAFAMGGERTGSDVHGRMFGFGVGIPEDAASGGAQGPLGAYLVRHGLVKGGPMTRMTSEQGFEMGRPSILEIEVETDAGHTVTAVRVGGRCVLAGGGWIDA